MSSSTSTVCGYATSVRNTIAAVAERTSSRWPSTTTPSQPSMSSRRTAASLGREVVGLRMMDDEGVGGLLRHQLEPLRQLHPDPLGAQQLHHLRPRSEERRVGKE